MGVMDCTMTAGWLTEPTNAWIPGGVVQLPASFAALPTPSTAQQHMGLTSTHAMCACHLLCCCSA